jgi:hypothetical protein
MLSLELCSSLSCKSCVAFFLGFILRGLAYFSICLKTSIHGLTLLRSYDYLTFWNAEILYLIGIWLLMKAHELFFARIWFKKLWSIELQVELNYLTLGQLVLVVSHLLSSS